MKSIQVRTADGVRLVGMHVTTERDERDLAIVLAHGFTVTTARPHVQRVAARFARSAGVVMVDFRGHGRSEGRTTAGDFEVLDLDATVRWARQAGYRRVGTVGFSMGGAVVLRHAARSSSTTGLAPVEPVGPDDAPPLTVVVPAYLEAGAIGGKVADLFANGYPGPLTVLVVAEDPETAAAARAAGATVLQPEGRLGKSGALNLGMTSASTDLVVATDANNHVTAGSLALLAAHFATPASSARRSGRVRAAV